MSIALMADQFDYLLKLVVIGDSGVGKTNLLSRFATNQFSIQSKPTIGVQFATKTLKISNSNIKVQIWDTAGQERFRAITHAYYKGATGALLVFDLTRHSTFQNLSKWLKQLKDNAEQNIICALIGNKSDLTDKKTVLDDEIAQYAQENKLFYMETSALQSINVEKAFMSVVNQIYNQIKKSQHRKQPVQKSNIKKIQPEQTSLPPNSKITLNQKKNKSKTKKKCCE